MNTDNSTGPLNSPVCQRDYWFWVINGVIDLVIIAGNGLVIYFIATRPSLRETTGNWFVLSLAFVDFLIGVFTVPTLHLCSFWLHCNMKIFIIFYELLMFISVGNLCAMALDRYISICYPLQYTAIMTHSLVIKVISVGWGVPGLMSFTPVFWRFSRNIKLIHLAEQVYRAIAVSLFVILPCICLLLTYVRILCIARRISKQTSSQKMHLELNDISVGDNHKNSKSRRNTRNRIRQDRNASIKIIGAVIILFVFCWVISGVRAICTFYHLCHVTEMTVCVSRTLINMNSAVNPLVYSLFKKDIKAQLKSFCKCKT